MNNNENMSPPKPGLLKIWFLAIRPKTLPASTGPVLVGLGLALGDGVFKFGPAIATLLAALLLQITSNLANDVYDFKKGTDTKERLGPLRVTQAGLLSPRQVMGGIAFVLGLAFLLGLYLVYVGGWPILVIGFLSAVAAIAYTAGPFPLGYKGVADIFVFVFFGLIAVCGAYYLQAGYVSPAAWWASVPAGLLVVAILVVNNLRDIETDRQAGKKTPAVRFGVRFTQLQYLTSVGAAYLITVLMWLLGIAPNTVFLVALSLPLAVRGVKDVFTLQGPPLNATLAVTARLVLVYCILFAMGYCIGFMG
ncbi:MAG: 1,4-dihydroxy-2-naphthoate polyprenyltransferase [Firmicutes bacterium]|nr:1,4-dihydroxy-2-naphthoate polyprenyltransferase [Bacillota bacterium]